MKACIILAFATLIAAAAADFNHLMALNQAVSASDCTVQQDGYLVNLTSVPVFDNTVAVSDSIIGVTEYNVVLSACQPINITGCSQQSFVSVSHGNYQACYSTAPTYTYNTTTNVTTAVFTAPTSLKRSVLLSESDNAAYSLTVQYKCSMKPDLASMGGEITGDTMALLFSTDAACASVAPTTVAPSAVPTATPAPSDDKKGLSSWVIVVIIVAAVVAILIVAVTCWKCRGTKKEEAEGVYSRVA